MKAKKKNFFSPTIKISLILIALVILGIFFIFITDFSGGREPIWGVTFSRSYALDLQLDWQQAYLAVLDDLKVSHLRLPAYWDEIEKDKDRYDFTDLDWQIAQAAQRKVTIILTVGRRLPRWPECHDPGWVKHYSTKQANDEVLELLLILVQRYRSWGAVGAWQVENEPLFPWFGFCPPPDEAFLREEISIIKSLDPYRPIIITDTGELSTWQRAAGLADVLGTTMYRIVWNKRWGFFDYWFVPPAFYRFKADLALAKNRNLKNVIVTELQMEPWSFDKRMVDLTLEQQQRSFDLKRFQDNIKYARKTGFSEIYLWGAEYWYWLKEQGQPEFWQEAKKLWW